MRALKEVVAHFARIEVANVNREDQHRQPTILLYWPFQSLPKTCLIYIPRHHCLENVAIAGNAYLCFPYRLDVNIVDVARKVSPSECHGRIVASRSSKTKHTTTSAHQPKIVPVPLSRVGPDLRLGRIENETCSKEKRGRIVAG